MMVAILGPDELAAGKVKVRNMASHEERLVSIERVRAILGKFGGMPFSGDVVAVEDIFDAE